MEKTGSHDFDNPNGGDEFPFEGLLADEKGATVEKGFGTSNGQAHSPASADNRPLEDALSMKNNSPGNKESSTGNAMVHDFVDEPDWPTEFKPIGTIEAQHDDKLDQSSNTDYDYSETDKQVESSKGQDPDLSGNNSGKSPNTEGVESEDQPAAKPVEPSEVHLEKSAENNADDYFDIDLDDEATDERMNSVTSAAAADGSIGDSSVRPLMKATQLASFSTGTHPSSDPVEESSTIDVDTPSQQLARDLASDDEHEAADTPTPSPKNSITETASQKPAIMDGFKTKHQPAKNIGSSLAGRFEKYRPSKGAVPSLALVTPNNYGQKNSDAPKIRIDDGQLLARLQTPSMASPMPSWDEAKAEVSLQLQVEKYGLEGVEREWESLSADRQAYKKEHAADIPTYRFPGTWDTARHETYDAAKNIGAAAKTFGSAVGSSGIGKASWAVGSMVTAGVRRAVPRLTSQFTAHAIKASGYKETMPHRIQKFVDKVDEYERWKQDAEARRNKKKERAQTNRDDLDKYSVDVMDDGWCLVDKDEDFDEIDEQNAPTGSKAAAPVAEAQGKAAAPTSKPGKTLHVHNEPSSVNEELPHFSVYETGMALLENTALTAVQVGRSVSALTGKTKAYINQQREQHEIRRTYPTNEAWLGWINVCEREQSIPALVRRTYVRSGPEHAYPDPGAARDTDPMDERFDSMVMPEEEDDIED